MILRFRKAESVVWFGRSFEAFLRDCKHGAYTVEVKLDRTKRTIDQNRLYWLWMACLSEETGMSKDELHAIFAGLFLSEERLFNGETVRVIRSTSSLDTAQFKDYLDEIQRYCATELAIALPNPEDRVWAEFENHYKYKL